jgi:hypothetical protein
MFFTSIHHSVLLSEYAQSFASCPVDGDTMLSVIFIYNTCFGQGTMIYLRQCLVQNSTFESYQSTPPKIPEVILVLQVGDRDIIMGSLNLCTLGN